MASKGINAGDITNLSDEQLLRYSRQIMLPKFDVAGQLSLLNSRVLIIGLGGLGSPVAMYLASAGVGSLYLADDDSVDVSNLQRQVIHRESSVAELKVDSAAQALEEINPQIQVAKYPNRLSGASLQEAVQKVDLVLDCSDNFETRFEINRACVNHSIPLVSGAAIRMEGQVSVFDNRVPESPCYQCLFPEGLDDALSCSESGVMAPLVGIIGSMQAMEAIKIISGLGQNLSGRLLLLDAMTMDWRSLKLKRDANCPCCSVKSSI